MVKYSKKSIHTCVQLRFVLLVVQYIVKICENQIDPIIWLAQFKFYTRGCFVPMHCFIICQMVIEIFFKATTNGSETILSLLDKATKFCKKDKDIYLPLSMSLNAFCVIVFLF